MAGIRAEVIFEANVEQAKRSAEKAAGELNRIMGGVGKKQVGFNINSRSFTQPLGRITGSANEFTKSLEASNARVIAFGASVGIINGISDAFKNLVAETVRFEKTLADVNVVLDVSNASLQRFGQGLFDVAKNTAQSFGVAAEAALEFSRQGLTMEEVLKRTNDALTLTRLTGLKAAEAVSGLTAAVNAFSSVGLTTTQVIDKLAAVDVKFAVSSEDLINALERTGAVAIDAGVELDSLIGLVTSLQQTTARGGAVIGNGLKTIFTRIQRPKSLAQIEELDIAVRNLSGAILPADKILINIAKSFDTLTSSQKSNVVQFSAGIFQANVFRAALRDLGKTQSIQAKATEVSAGAAGEAAFKNEKLNKTIAALASQSGSAIEELAGVLGELMVKPEIGGFLDLFKGSIEGITNMLGGGEETGSTFAKGLVAGIGNILTGPAAIAFGAVFIKLFMNIAKFAQGSLKDVLDIVSRKDKIKKIEESILETLSKNKDIQESLNNLDGDREAQGKFILKVIEAQTNGMREQAALAKQLARPLLDAGVKTDLTVGGRGPIDLDGDGIAGTFGAGGVLPSSARKERKEASRGGYTAGAVGSMSMPGLGKVVYNKAETVKQFPGMQQPAIMPPQRSRAGGRYQDAFTEKHGFNPYASGGFIPNFAALDGGALRLNQSKMHLYANPREATPGGDAVRNAMKALVDSGKPVTVSATTDKLLKGEGGSHTKAIKGLIRFIADQENGPKLFERDFKLTNLPWKGNKGEDASEDAVAKLLNKDGKKYINTGKRPGAHGDKTFPVDLIGEGLDPVEVKSGEWKQPNILLKSMRLYSDDELIQFAERQYGATPEMLTGARMEKLGKSARLLQGKGLLDKDASLEDQHNAAMKYGIAGGFVPNYAKGPATNEVTKKMWEDLTDWLLQQEAAGEVIARTEVLDDSSLPQTLKNSSAFPGSPRGVSSKLSRLLGTGEGKEAAGVRKQAEKYLGTNKYGDLIRAGRAVLPAGLGQGGVPVLPPHIKKKALPPWDWGAGEVFSRQATLGKIMSQKGGESLNNLASGGTAGMAFRDTVIGEKGFNQLANMWPDGPSAGSLAGLARTLYTADIRPYHPYELKDGTINKNAPISQAQLISAGVGAAGFEKMAASMTGAGTPTSGIGGQAPLDFTGPNGEAKNIKDFLKTQGNKGKVGGAFSWAQMIGKILRSNIGNNPALTSLGGPSFQALWSSASGLGTNLFVPELASGIVPNFAGDTTLYRGTSAKYQKAVPDRPNPPQFLFDKILAAKTKIGFLSAVEELAIQHAKGEYSGSYNTDLKPATLEQMRGGEELGAGEVQHAGYIYKRPTKGGRPKNSSEGTTMPSGFVSKSKNRDVADRFSRALEFKLQSGHDQQGQIHEDRVPNSRIFNRAKLEKYVDRFGVEKVQTSFSQGMKNGTLKNLYLNLDTWNDETEEGERRRSYDETHNYRSIGHAGAGMTFNEEEYTQVWDRHSPFYGAGKGLVPNFADNRNRQQKISDVLGDPSNAGINFKGGKPRSIKSKNMFQKMWLESYFKTGLEGDYQMLMKMGYDPDELLSLRSFASKGGEVNILGKGFVPNFANPLKEAIAREAGAGIPKSQIKVEQSGQLRGPGNPMGLAVTNKRDEPLGVGQGIRRARSRGIDPRKHGAAGGMIPNFADGEDIPAALLDVLGEKAKETAKAFDQDLDSAIESTSKDITSMGLTVANVTKDLPEVEGQIKDTKGSIKAEKSKLTSQQDPKLIENLEKHVQNLTKVADAIKAKDSADSAASAPQQTKATLKDSKIMEAARKLEVKAIQQIAVTSGKARKELQATVDELQDFQDKLSDVGATTEEENDVRGNGLQQLFYMQSAISLTNGFLEQFSEGARGATKTFLDLATAATSVTAAYIQQKELVNQGMSMAGVGSNEKGFTILGGDSWEQQRNKGAATEKKIRGDNLKSRGGKGLSGLGNMGATIGKLGRTFGRFLPIVGQLYTGFTMANEAVKFITKTFDGLSIFGMRLEKGEGIMDLFASASTRATKRMEELSKTADSLKAALGGLESKEREQIELRKLENKGTSRTIAEEKKYYDLRLKSIDTDIALSKAMGSLMDENKTGRRSLERINRVIGSTTLSMSDQRDGIRDLIIANQMLMAATSQRAGFQEGIDRADSDDDSARLIALAETRGVQMALAMGAAFEGKKGASAAEKTEALSHNIRELEKAISFRHGNASGVLARLDFDTNEAIGSTGITEMLRGAIQDIDEFQWDAGGLSDTESEAYKKGIQELINMLQKRKDAQSKGAKDDVDIRIESLKQLKLAIFESEQARERAKQTHKMVLEQNLHDSALANIKNDILKDYEGISNQAHIELKAARDKSDLTSKFNSAEKAARLDALDKLDKISGEKLTDPGSVSAKLKTDLGNKTGDEAQAALTRFRQATEKAARSKAPLRVGDKVVTDDERGQVQKALEKAAQRGLDAQGKELDLVKKLQFIHEEMQVLGTARLRVILRTLLHEGEIIDRKTKEKTDLDKLLLETARGIETRGKTFELDKKMLAQTRMQSLIAEKTVAGAEELQKLLASGVPLHQAITTNLAGEAATLAVINKFQEDRLYYLRTSQDFERKAFETQKEKNRTEGESQLLALRQLQYQEDGLALSLDSQIAQEAKLKMEILTASQSAREAEAQRKFFSNLENRRALVEKQISAEMSGLKHTQGINQETLKQKVLTVKIKDMAKLELREQETALSTEALKNAELATNLSHLREAGSLTDMANRLQEKSNKLIEAQNAVRQASISRGDLAFNARANLNTEQAGAIGETRGAAMRSLMTNSPEDALAFASSLEATNKQLNNGSRAIDRLRVRMTELDVSAKNLGADLVELGFDGVRSGFKNLLEQIGTGAKSAGDAWKEFGLNLTKTLLDRITDHNIDRIVKDLSFAFTGVEVKSEAKKIASSNSHLMDHLSSLTKSNDSLKDGILSLERQLKEGIKLRPEPKDESTPPVIPDKMPGQYWTGMGPRMPAATSTLGTSASNAIWVQTQGGFGARGTSPSGGNAPLVFEPDNDTISIGKNSALSKAIAGSNPPMPITEREEIVKREQDNATRLTNSLNLLRGEKQSGKIFNLAGVSKAQGIANNAQGIHSFAKRAGEVRETIDKKIEDLESKRDNRLAQQADLASANQRYRDRDWDGKEPSPRGLNYRNQTGDPNASTLDKTLMGFNRDIYYPYGSESEGKAREVIEYENRQSQAAAAGKEAEGIQAKIDQLKNLKDKQVDEAKDALDRWTDHQRQIQSLTEETSRQVDLAKRLTADLEKSASDARAVFSAAADSLSAKKPPVLTTTVKTPAAKVDAVSMDVDAARVNFFGNIHQVDRQQGGGIIQHFADGGFVKGPGGKDKVPAMLTAGEFVVPKKEADNIQKFNNGTDRKGAEKKSTPGERLQSGVEGGLKMWAMSETAKAVAKAMDDDADKPPTFNMKKLDNLDLGSDVNIKRGDPRLSSKFLARDPVMQEYRDYLIESANYKAQKTNENFRENMSTFASVFSAVTSFVTAELMSYAAPVIQKGMTAAKNWGGKTFGKYGPEYKAALSEIGPGIDYADIKSSMKTGEPINYKGVSYELDPFAAGDLSGGNRFNRKVNDPTSDFGGGAGRAWKPMSYSGQGVESIMKHRQSPMGGANFRGELWDPSTASFDHGINVNNPFYRALGGKRGLPKTKTRQGGGSIPAMLTAGEGYIPEPIAKRIGYNNLSHMNNTGTMPIVKGTGGVDNVGPVGLNSGDFIMKKSSTNKLLRDNPNAMRFSLQGQSDGRKGAQGYYEGGVVGSELTVPARSLGPQKSQQGNRLGLLDQKESEKSDSGAAGSTTNAETTNNININISIDKAGAEVESQEGGEDSYEKERNLSMKIKGAVLEVIREEKRIGGELS